MTGDRRKNDLLWIEAQLDEAGRVHDAIRGDLENLAVIAGAIADAFRAGGRVFFLGNGGSAADAQHWAAELSGRFYLDRESLPAIALTTNTSQITAIGNDYGFEDVFARPLQSLAQRGDVVIAISTSGASANVLKAIDIAKRIGALTVGFGGGGSAPMAARCDHLIRIASRDVARIQEGHELCAHLICSLVERALFGGDAESAR